MVIKPQRGLRKGYCGVGPGTAVAREQEAEKALGLTIFYPLVMSK